jgi:DAACS family dicarboxylate/amino acid:cation (Na+ or H+) symporter
LGEQRQAFWIFVGLAVGALLALVARQLVAADELPAFTAAITAWTKPLGNLFLRLVMMVVVPLIFAALVVGIASVGDVRRLGKIGVRCGLYTLIFSTASVLVALVLVNWVQPGRALAPETRTRLEKEFAVESAKKIEQADRARPVGEVLLDLIPENPLAEAVNALEPDRAKGGLLAVMVFALLFGVALSLCPAEQTAPLMAVLEGLFAVCLRIIQFAMRLAPFGVGCIAFNLILTTGLALLSTLAGYVTVVVAAILVQMVGVYGGALWLLARVSPLEFFKRCRVAMITAFATSSSNATLPTALRVAEENLRLRPEVSRFVLTVGASANQNGTALYEGVTVLFLAQVFGVPLDFGQQAVVALMCILAGVGTAGVPGGSLPLVVGVLKTVQVPAASISIILGIDRFLDMCRTTLNVTGDLAIAALVSGGIDSVDHSEGTNEQAALP